MLIEIVPFHAGLIPPAAALLAARHRRDREVLPELPQRFEDAAAARAAVEAAWRQPHGGGVAALHGGQLQGYLVGNMVMDDIWGRSGWVRLAGCALAADQNAELVRDLYAVLGGQWAAFGCFAHFALVPTADPALVHAWFALSFGIEQVHALLALDGLDLPPPTPLQSPPGIEIRRAGPQDRDVLAELSGVIWRHQTQAPVWGIHLPEDAAEVRAGWAGLADDPTVTVWLALDQGQALGCQGYFPAEPADDDMLIPEQCTRLAIAGTREGARGRGIGRALTHHGLAHARASGYRYCETD